MAQQLERPEAPAVLAPSFDPGLAAAMQRQAARVRMREFRPLGVLERIQLEASGIAVVNGNSLKHNPKRSASIDYYKTGPLVGISLDDRELLICSPLIAPPPIPDPRWAPDPVYDAYGRVVQQDVPMIEQDLRELAAGEIEMNGRRLVVFQPIHQLLLIAQNRKGWIHVNWSADERGRHCCLLYDARRRTGHFLCGRPEIVTYE